MPFDYQRGVMAKWKEVKACGLRGRLLLDMFAGVVEMGLAMSLRPLRQKITSLEEQWTSNTSQSEAS